MAKIAARNAGVVVSGHDITGESNRAVLTLSAESPEVSCFGNTNRQRLSDSVSDVEFRLDAYFNTSPSSTDLLFGESMGAYKNLAFLPQGMSTCKLGYAMNTISTSYEIVNALAEACTVSANFTGGSIARGRIAYAGAAAGSAETAGVNFNAADATTYYTLHVFSASTSVSASLQHSADDSAWTTGAVHDGLTASGVAYTGTIATPGQYRRLRYAYVGGSGALLATFSGSSA